MCGKEGLRPQSQIQHGCDTAHRRGVMRWVQAKQWAAGVQHGRLQKAAGLQLEAFWQHHRSKVLAAGGVALIYILWSVCKASVSAGSDTRNRMAGRQQPGGGV